MGQWLDDFYPRLVGIKAPRARKGTTHLAFEFYERLFSFETRVNE